MISVGANDNYVAYGVQKYIVDYSSDIGSLPTHCATGSTAFVIDTSATYMMNSQKEWKLIKIGGSGGGSGSGGEDMNAIVRIYVDNKNNHLMYETADGEIHDAGEIDTSSIETQIVSF